jgi:hypothetical protein
MVLLELLAGQVIFAPQMLLGQLAQRVEVRFKQMRAVLLLPVLAVVVVLAGNRVRVQEIERLAAVALVGLGLVVNLTARLVLVQVAVAVAAVGRLVVYQLAAVAVAVLVFLAKAVTEQRRLLLLLRLVAVARVLQELKGFPELVEHLVAVMVEPMEAAVAAQAKVEHLVAVLGALALCVSCGPVAPAASHQLAQAHLNI